MRCVGEHRNLLEVLPDDWTVFSNYRLALRRDKDGTLDDVVVSDVSMFRAEMMDDRTLWLACYLPGTGDEGDRITFLVTVDHRCLQLHLAEAPRGTVDLDSGTVLITDRKR